MLLYLCDRKKLIEFWNSKKIVSMRTEEKTTIKGTRENIYFDEKKNYREYYVYYPNHRAIVAERMETSTQRWNCLISRKKKELNRQNLNSEMGTFLNSKICWRFNSFTWESNDFMVGLVSADCLRRWTQYPDDLCSIPNRVKKKKKSMHLFFSLIVLIYLLFASLKLFLKWAKMKLQKKNDAEKEESQELCS